MIVEAPPVSPFKGLAAFDDSELDALFFFGRERERTVLVANMVASRLTVLYGESGVGKSSLLAAGVMRELRALAPDAVVALRNTWSGSIHDVLDEVRSGEEAYLILDQFEEYFLYHGEDDGPGALLLDLPELLRESHVNVLIALREDSLARLDAFKARIPSVFGNQVRLEHLDREAARSAIIGPVARWNELTEERVEIEPELVETVLDEVSPDSDRIEAPYLQLVLDRIWHAERAEGSPLLRLETLRRLGGAETIVRDHLLVALEDLADDEQDVAASMFEHLVTPSGTKIAHRAPDLAGYANVPEGALRRVLAALTRDRIVHSVDGSDRYEIFHDVLAEPIRAWQLERRLERERLAARRRQRRLYVLSAASLVALAIVAGLAVWAFSERGSAQAQARHARARELVAKALQQLPIDPNRSTRLSLAAARLEPGQAAETLLRQSLIADRLRLVRHVGGAVPAIAFSRKSDRFAAAVTGGRVLLFDGTGHLMHTLAGVGGVVGLDFTLDGRRLVTTSPTAVARMWDARTGRRVPLPARLAGARGPNGGLVLIPLRGRLAHVVSHMRRLSAAANGAASAAAVEEPGGRVRTWLFDRRGRRLHVLPQKGINDIAFSPDGNLVATASADGFTIVWNARTGKRLHKLADSSNGVNALEFSPDGKLLATGGKDSVVRIWTVATGERTFPLFGHTNPVTALRWSPDGRLVVSASPDRTVILWRVQNLVGAGTLGATLSTGGGPVSALAFSSDSTRLVTGGDDETVRVWDARPDQELDLLGRGPGSALAARWAGDTIAAAWSSGVVKTYNARTRRLLHAFRSPGAAFTSLGVSRDGSVIAAGGADGTTRVWDSGTRRPLAAAVGPAPVLAVAVSPSGDLVASGDRRGIVRVWDPRGVGLRWSAPQDGEVLDVAFSARGDRIVTSGPHGAVVWSASIGNRLRDLPAPDGVVRAAFSTDGRLVATAGSDANGRLWFARTGRLYRTLRGHDAPLTDVAFSDDGRLLATSSEDDDARIWNVTTGVHRTMKRAAFGALAAIDLDDTGRWVVAAGPFSALVWNASTGQQLFYLRGHGPLLTAASFAPRGPTILTASRDGTVRTYTCDVCVDLSVLIRIAERRLAQTR